jgi:hypothetical protein
MMNKEEYVVEDLLSFYINTYKTYNTDKKIVTNIYLKRNKENYNVVKFIYLEDKECFIEGESGDESIQINIKFYDNYFTLEELYFDVKKEYGEYDEIFGCDCEIIESYKFLKDRNYRILYNINKNILKKYHDLFHK